MAIIQRFGRYAVKKSTKISGGSMQTDFSYVSELNEFIDTIKMKYLDIEIKDWIEQIFTKIFALRSDSINTAPENSDIFRDAVKIYVKGGSVLGLYVLRLMFEQNERRERPEPVSMVLNNFYSLSLIKDWDFTILINDAVVERNKPDHVYPVVEKKVCESGIYGEFINNYILDPSSSFSQQGNVICILRHNERLNPEDDSVDPIPLIKIGDDALLETSVSIKQFNDEHLSELEIPMTSMLFELTPNNYLLFFDLVKHYYYLTLACVDKFKCSENHAQAIRDCVMDERLDILIASSENGLFDLSQPSPRPIDYGTLVGTEMGYAISSFNASDNVKQFLVSQLSQIDRLLLRMFSKNIPKSEKIKRVVGEKQWLLEDKIIRDVFTNFMDHLLKECFSSDILLMKQLQNTFDNLIVDRAVIDEENKKIDSDIEKFIKIKTSNKARGVIDEKTENALDEKIIRAKVDKESVQRLQDMAVVKCGDLVINQRLYISAISAYLDASVNEFSLDEPLVKSRSSKTTFQVQQQMNTSTLYRSSRDNQSVTGFAGQPDTHHGSSMAAVGGAPPITVIVDKNRLTIGPKKKPANNSVRKALTTVIQHYEAVFKQCNIGRYQSILDAASYDTIITSYDLLTPVRIIDMPLIDQASKQHSVDKTYFIGSLIKLQTLYQKAMNHRAVN
jgi:hypothetical protein